MLGVVDCHDATTERSEDNNQFAVPIMVDCPLGAES